MLTQSIERQTQFREWLQRNRGLSLKTAGDANSRAKRAESALGEPLDSLIAKGASLAEITARLSERLALTTESKVKAERAVPGLQRAVRLYMEFRRAR
jgi:hypothetical protein